MYFYLKKKFELDKKITVLGMSSKKKKSNIK